MAFSLFKKNKKDFLPVWVWQEDREIKRVEMEVTPGAVIDSKNSRAYHMIHDLMIRDHIVGGLTLVVWQRDAFPKNPFRSLDNVRQSQLEDINRIANEKGRTAKDQALLEAYRNKMVMMLTTMGYVFGIAVLLGIAFMVVRSGGVSNLKFW